MSDEKGLLAAIRANPDDDTPRLVYADWLQENGQPERAEFIRVQIEAVRLRWNDPRWNELTARVKHLLEAHGEEWIEPFGWISPGGKTEVLVSEPTVDGWWGGGVQLSWVDPHPSDMGDSAPPYQRSIDFSRGFPRKIWLEPDALQIAPETEPTSGPRPQLILTWIPNNRNESWVDAIWPVVTRAVHSGRFSDWVFATSYHHQYRWLHLLPGSLELARGVSGIYLEVAGGAVVPNDADITNLYRLMPGLDDLAFDYGEWSPHVIRELGPTGLSRRLRHLLYHDNTGVYSASDALRAMADAGDWPELIGLELEGLEGVGPETAGLIRRGMLPALKRLSIGSRGVVPRAPARAFINALIDHPNLSHVEQIQYIPWPGSNDPALKKLAARSNGRFVYGYRSTRSD